MPVEYKIAKNRYSSEQDPHIQFHNTDTLTPRAEFVKELIARWGMVAALDGGEDSSGRHKLNLMPPADVVNRAMEMSDLMYKAFNDNDLIVKLPSLSEMKAIADEMKETDRAAMLLDRITARAKRKEEETE